MKIEKPSDVARIAKTERQARGLTQQEVADGVGITRQSLARLERGHGGASFETVLRVFDLLDIRLDAGVSSRAASSADTPSVSTASSRTPDTSIPLESWRAALDGRASQLREELTRAAGRIDATHARAAIEAGDPDREPAVAADPDASSDATPEKEIHG